MIDVFSRPQPQVGRFFLFFFFFFYFFLGVALRRPFFELLHGLRLYRAVGVREHELIGVDIASIRTPDLDVDDLARIDGLPNALGAGTHLLALLVVPVFVDFQQGDRAVGDVLDLHRRDDLVADFLRLRLDELHIGDALDRRAPPPPPKLWGPGPRRGVGWGGGPPPFFFFFCLAVWANAAGINERQLRRNNSMRTLSASHSTSRGYLAPRGDYCPTPNLYISPFQSSGSGFVERKTSRCHLPPPHGSITSAATTSTRISPKLRPSGSPSRW